MSSHKWKHILWFFNLLLVYIDFKVHSFLNQCLHDHCLTKNNTFIKLFNLTTADISWKVWWKYYFFVPNKDLINEWTLVTIKNRIFWVKLPTVEFSAKSPWQIFFFCENLPVPLSWWGTLARGHKGFIIIFMYYCCLRR